jgi:hypothetical protein
MKKLLFIIALAVFSTVGFSQTKAEDLVKFEDLKYDFGKMKQGVPATYDFVFSNISTKPVVIETATASCGCTTPKWPQEPVMSKKSEKINVGYNAAAVGTFSKTITVKVASVDMPVTLTISGEVLTADAYDAYVKEKNKSKPGGKSGK